MNTPFIYLIHPRFITTLLIISVCLVSSCSGSKKTVKVPPKPVKGKVVVERKDIPSPPPRIDPFADSDTLKKLQILLYLSGYEPGKIDGTLKEQTVKALDEFQQLRNLRVGDRSDTTLRVLGVPQMVFEVKDLQETLAKKGYDPGPVDDIVGPMTRSAYIEFLQNNELPTLGLSEEVRTALFSTDPKYNKPVNTDPLFRTGSGTFTVPYHSNVRLRQATVQDVQQALKAHGYDPGENVNEWTPPSMDALFLFQRDKKLQMGGMNDETLRALGFKD